jgi:tripartite-type tricarboxylate transporter receptor subunit TctC
VPYKGAGPAIAALLAGEIHVQFSSITGILPHARAGRVRALATTGIKRTTSAPDVPTVMESGLPAFSVIGWYGLLAPAKTPTAVLDKLNNAVNRALVPLTERLRDLGNEEAGGTRAAFAAFLATEVTRWAAVVKAAGVTAE